MKFSITVIIICFTLNLVAQDLKRKIAIIPFYTNGSPNLALNNEIISVFSPNFQVVNQDKLINNLTQHEDFNKLVYLLTSDNYKYSSLTNEQIAKISAYLSDADLLLIGKELNQRTITKLNKSGIIKLKGEFIILDLNKHKLINISHVEDKKYDRITNESPPPYKEFFINVLSVVTKKIE